MREPRFVEIRPRTRSLGHAVLHLAQVDTTMHAARERAEAGTPEGLVVVADRQTAGLGRHGRTWTSAGASLHATLLLRPARPPSEWALLPFAAALAVLDAARKLARVDARLKWPNDIVHKDRKLGGVLVDAVYDGGQAPAFVLLGLGVNGDARPEDFPDSLRASSTSLSQAAGRHVCLPALLKLFLEAFEPRYEALREGRPEAVWAQTRTALGTLGRRVRVRTPEDHLEGEAVDLGPEGELLVRTEHGVSAVRWGDCEELRPA